MEQKSLKSHESEPLVPADAAVREANTGPESALHDGFAANEASARRCDAVGGLLATGGLPTGAEGHPSQREAEPTSPLAAASVAEPEDGDLALLKAAISRPVRRRSTTSMWLELTLSAMFLPVMVVALLCWAGFPTSSGPARDMPVWQMVGLMMAGLPLNVGLAILKDRRQSAQAAQLLPLLERARKRRQIGVIAQAMFHQNLRITRKAREFFEEMLPDMQAGDWARVDEAGREQLRAILADARGPSNRRFLNSWSPLAYQRKVDLHCTLLKAMEQFGGERDLELVGKLAKGEAAIWLNHPPDPRIAQAAAECLPYLQQAASAARVAGELLRAAGPMPLSAELLRSGAPDPGPGELLRAGQCDLK